MFDKSINKVIRKLGRKDYSLDPDINTGDLVIIIVSKIFQLLRGFRIKYILGSCKGLLFLGSRCRFRHKSHIHFGKTIIIGDNVEINALSREGVRIGNNVSIHKNSIIECTGVLRNIGVGIVIGNNVGIAQNCFIQVRAKVVIGNDVIFGPGVSLFSENHNYSDLSKFIHEQGETRSGVVIEEGVWVGSGAIILDGVTIGRNSVIAAGSVVNKNIPSYCIAGGIPAKVIKMIKI
jgi:acetyltransferase-like isoleucine patch superfamily enzyme